MGDINWSDILPIVIVASTVLTVAVGLIGLRQGHYRSGKLTRRGRQSVAIIIALGLVTLVSTFADRQISAAKEAADAELRTRQFDRQMASLKGVTGDLGTVRGSLQESLRKQEQLYDVASENVRMSGALQSQTQANTVIVLRRVFQEGNRVAAERIAISVSFVCRQPDEDSDRPRLHIAYLFLRYGDNPSISLASNQQLQFGVDSIFHGFSGDLGRFESFDAWRNASVSIVLRANVPEAADGYRMEQMMRLDELNRQRGGRPPRPAICSAGVRLLLNGRQVLVAEKLFRPTDNGTYVAEMLNLRVDPNRLPRF